MKICRKGFPLQGRHVLLQKTAIHLGIDAATGDSVNLDIAWSKFFGKTSGERVHATLTG